MIRNLFFAISLFAISNSAVAQTQFGSDIEGEAANDAFGNNVSLSLDGNIIAVAAKFNGGNGNISGHVRLYNKISGVWTQIGTDINGESAGDQSGYCISLSSDGSVVAIGAPYNDGNGFNSGHVRVYKNISGIWTQIGNDINGKAIGNNFGLSVSLSADGNTVAVGGPGNDDNGNNSGHVRVYKNFSGVWVKIGADLVGEASEDDSGSSISLSADGNTLPVGGLGNDANGANSGHVRVYKNISGVWTRIGSDIDGEATGDASGYILSLSANGNIIAIGAHYNHGNGYNSGHVRVYQSISGVWTQIGNDIDGEAAGDVSGESISLSGNGAIIAIGAKLNRGNGIESGHVRVYQNISGTWTQIGNDINGETLYDMSGNVALSSDGRTLAVGAERNDGNGNDSGHVRVYDLSLILSSDSFVLENFKVFPNPTTEKVTISLQENLELEKVIIYNTLGQFIKTEKNNVINVTGFAKGSYFFEVITNKGKATKTIVIQ